MNKIGTITKKLLFFILIISAAYFWSKNRPVRHGPGVIAPNPPLQYNICKPQPFTYKEHTIYPLATFEITARVLSRKNYSHDLEAKISPVDFALGWGPMSDEEVLDKISISQSSRFYFWNTNKYPIPRREIETNSANMHLVPATPDIEECLKSVKKGQLINLKGYLIRAETANKRRWQSSLTRNDTGPGSCELIWVEQANILPSPNTWD